MSASGLVDIAAVGCMLISACHGFGLIAVVDDDAGHAAALPTDAGSAVVDAARPASDADTLAPAADASAAAGGQGALMSPDAGVCDSARAIEICNPITNTGCSAELDMQCDVDLLASALQGQCVFRAVPTDASTCLNVPPTETCPPGQTCVAFGECRRICLCNSDCEPGSCCTEPLGEYGFRTCVPCG